VAIVKVRKTNNSKVCLWAFDTPVAEVLGNCPELKAWTGNLQPDSPISTDLDPETGYVVTEYEGLLDTAEYPFVSATPANLRFENYAVLEAQQSPLTLDEAPLDPVQVVSVTPVGDPLEMANWVFDREVVSLPPGEWRPHDLPLTLQTVVDEYSPIAWQPFGTHGVEAMYNVLDSEPTRWDIFAAPAEGVIAFKWGDVLEVPQGADF
jgi:hypothetical protein